jgi:hypothetical protein
MGYTNNKRNGSATEDGKAGSRLQPWQPGAPLRQARDTGFCKFFRPHRDDRFEMPGMCRVVKGEIDRTHRCHQPAFPPPINLPRRRRTNAEKTA